MAKDISSPKRFVWPKPNWGLWGSKVEARLSEAVALSIDLVPEGQGVGWCGRVHWLKSSGDPLDQFELLDMPNEVGWLPEEFTRRLDIAYDHVRANVLPVASYTELPTRSSSAGFSSGEPRVRLAEFAGWAAALPQPWPLPKKFPRSPIRPERKPEPRWPWGSHETELLRTFAAAGEQFFSSPQTPRPQKKAVSAWLRERGVVERTADEMAKILCG